MEKFSTLAVFAFIVLAACGGESPSGANTHTQTPTNAAPPLDPKAVFHEVRIELGPDGAVVHTPRAITAGELWRQHQERLAIERGEVAVHANITVEGTCPGTSMWIYDRPDVVGNRICFEGAGLAVLANYYLWIRPGGSWIPIRTWEISSGSYWAGSSAGFFGVGAELHPSSDASYYETMSFDGWEKQNFELGQDKLLTLLLWN